MAQKHMGLRVLALLGVCFTQMQVYAKDCDTDLSRLARSVIRTVRARLYAKSLIFYLPASFITGLPSAVYTASCQLDRIRSTAKLPPQLGKWYVSPNFWGENQIACIFFVTILALVCLFSFKELEDAKRQISGTRWHCSLCGETLPTEILLDRHLHEKHPDNILLVVI